MNLNSMLSPLPLLSSRRRLTWLRRFINLLLLITLLFPFSLVGAAPIPQTIPAAERAQALLNSLTPEERVGQLFLASFKGTDAETDSEVYDLIVNRYIGGVILMAGNDNFSADPEGLMQILSMNRQLQLNRWVATQQTQVNTAGEPFSPTFIPLFITIAQEGDGYPYDQILNGLTPLPNEMALGATWNPDLVSQAGNVLGHELSALGINMLLGPSLDVLEAPGQEVGSGLGTRAFGGDPFWVARLGQAYISGVHQGSAGKVAVVAKHFPGNGGADRLPEEEVATVRKSLEQLQNFDLAPFFEVTGNAPSSEMAADGLLTSHIRYQGFQGNIRATTRPVSFDQQALNMLLNLPMLASWRQGGGVMVSDNLGSRAVRRFYELTNPNQPFDASRVALNAFLAGNDLLYLGEITEGDDPDAYTTTVTILNFFAQKYRDDPAFAQRVDDSARRILTLKYRLYGDFSLSNTLPSLEGLGDVGQAHQLAFEIANQAATLISPTLPELEDTLPDPPNRNQRIVFITDVRSAKQCSQCPEQPILGLDSFQQAVLRLYGPQAGRQVTPVYLSSYSYIELLDLLDGDEDAFPLERDLRRANWVVFAMLDVTADAPSTQALNRFLAERPELFQQKRLVVFAFNAPYFLDATNIAKLTAYYGLYSKTPSSIDVAARLLFRELTPSGTLPISVPGIGYDLISATMPDPNQVIPLTWDINQPTLPDGTATPEPAPMPEYHVGDLIPVRAGVILDHNGHPVPDGTPVQFIILLNGEVSAPPQVENTRNGVATSSIDVTASGMLEVRVESEPAKQSDVLRIEIPAAIGDGTPTATLEPSPTPTASPSPTLEPTPIPVALTSPPIAPHLRDWLIAMLLTIIVSVSSYQMASFMGQVRWGVRSGFMALIGGLAAYTYLALDLPGSKNILDSAGAWGIILVTLIGCTVGIIGAWSWRALHLKPAAKT